MRTLARYKNFTLRRRDVKVPQRKSLAYTLRLCVTACAVYLFACGPSEIKPVDIYPEDMCSQCRMAISEPVFASEIITTAGDVFKFDDLGCLEKFQEKSGELKISAAFVKDYETKNWLLYEHSTIVQTSLQTPMGSGKIAFADPAQAREYREKFPTRE
ncbi:hypothetical protein EDS67_05085 [candidate division KSB1 bacterium]|nr:MAG: hypothetical protein EDS67_05085 [candidate division KSB1 bacterium]MBC6948526.1 hypothetical protein [candidate division KSB1 bacterium]MCE7940736.1 hypothetical protein [Chlorobi bacterium CHB1]MDL1874296.1 hypothetical protein [Cytophagia bacterium CHB2]